MSNNGKNNSVRWEDWSFEACLAQAGERGRLGQNRAAVGVRDVGGEGAAATFCFALVRKRDYNRATVAMIFVLITRGLNVKEADSRAGRESAPGVFEAYSGRGLL